MTEKVLINKFHIENLKHLYFALREDDEITQSHINEIMDELSIIYHEVTGIDLELEEREDES